VRALAEQRRQQEPASQGSDYGDYDTPGPPDRKIQYSPYRRMNFHEPRFYFGDTHLHTSYSAARGHGRCTLGPDEAYRFAKGESSPPHRPRLGSRGRWTSSSSPTTRESRPPRRC